MGARFTLSNRFLKQRAGEGRRTWGTQGVNKVLALVDDALDGVTRPFGSALQVSNDADEARGRVVVCTLSEVALPDVPKWYLVVNPLSVPVVVSRGPSSVSVAAGQVATVLCDGTAVRLATQPKGFPGVIVPSAQAWTVPLSAYGALAILRPTASVAMPDDPPSGFRISLVNRTGNAVPVTADGTILADDYSRTLLVDQDGTLVVSDDGYEIGCTEEGVDGQILWLYDRQRVDFVWAANVQRWVTFRS